MDTYYFRQPFRLSPSSNFPPETSLDKLVPVNLQSMVSIELTGDPLPISSAKDFIILGKGFLDKESAAKCANEMHSKLARAFASIGIGADFGDRLPEIIFSSEGETSFRESTGMIPKGGERLKVGVESSETPSVFITVSVVASKGSNIEQFNKAMEFEPTSLEISEKERIAFVLYGAAAFATDPEARFMLLMMALETRIDSKLRDGLALEMIDEFLGVVETSVELEIKEKNSILGSLRHLRKESISEAGQSLVRGMGSDSYDGRSAEDFFKVCYQIRSDIVHGNFPRPKIDEIRHLAANLEILVGHLIAGPDIVREVLG